MDILKSTLSFLVCFILIFLIIFSTILEIYEDMKAIITEKKEKTWEQIQKDKANKRY